MLLQTFDGIPEVSSHEPRGYGIDGNTPPVTEAMAAAAFWSVKRMRRRLSPHEEDYIPKLTVRNRTLRHARIAGGELPAETDSRRRRPHDHSLRLLDHEGVA